MWKDIERISGVPFTKSASIVENNSAIAVDAKLSQFDSIDSRRLDSLRIALEKENESNASIQIELNKTKVALVDATSRMNDAERLNHLLSETIDKLRADNDAQRHDLLQLSASAANKGAQLEELNDQVKQLKTQLLDLAHSNTNLTTEHSQTCYDLELSTQRNLEQETELQRLALCLSDVKKKHEKDKEAAHLELKQRTMILQTKLQHAHEHMKELEAREQQALEAKREEADELPKLMEKFKSERETIRAEMTKLHHVEIERYKSHLDKASTQLKEMNLRLGKQAEEFRIQLNDAEVELKETSQALQDVRAELEGKICECKRLQVEVVQLKDDVNCSRDTFQSFKKEKADESQASQALMDRLQRQVEEAKELLENERSANATALSNLENTIIAMIRDTFTSRMQKHVHVSDAQREKFDES